MGQAYDQAAEQPTLAHRNAWRRPHGLAILERQRERYNWPAKVAAHDE